MSWFKSCEHDYRGELGDTGFSVWRRLYYYHKCIKCGKEERCTMHFDVSEDDHVCIECGQPLPADWPRR